MSAGLALGLVGAGLGSLVGQPMIGYAIGSAIGGVLFAPKIKTEGPRLTDLSIQSSAEGQPIFKIYGAMRTAGNVIWGKPIAEKKKKKKSGGKGGGGQTTTTYSYTVDFAVALCEGPVTAIRKIWADGKLIYDMSVLTAAEQAIVDAGGFVPNVISRVQSSTSKTTSIVDVGGTMRIYTGAETQLPDPLIESDLGVGNTPAYRGTCYVVFDNFKLADFGNRIPNITAEVVAAGSTAVQYLGKIGPFNTSATTLGPGDARVDVYSHYTNPDKVVAVSTWSHTYSTTTIVSGDPITVYPSGLSQYGSRGVVNGGAGLTLAFCDVPGFFTLGPSAGDNSTLRLYTVTGNAAPVLAGSFQPAGDDGGFYQIFGSASVVNYIGGEVWVINSVNKNVYSAIPHPSSIMELRGNIAGLYSGTLRSLFTGADVIYVLSGSANPYTLTVIDKSTFTVIGTESVPISPVDSAGEKPDILMYSDATGRIWFLYLSAGSNVKLYVIDGGPGVDYGIIPNYPIGIDETYTYSVSDGLLAIFQSQIGDINSVSLGYVHYWSLNAINSSAVPLSTIVADVCNEAGLDSSFVNVTDLASTMVSGYIRNAQMTARAALEPLASGFFFDAVESGDKIVFKKRGGASVATIDYDDLGAASEGAQEDRIVTTVTQDNELPIELNMQYTDPARDFQIGSQRSRRQIPKSQKIDTMQMPIAWSGTEAKQAVEKLHYTAWESRTVHAFSLPLKYLRLEPADVITLPINNVSRRVRLTKTTVGSVIQCEAESDYAASYISESIAAENPAGPQEILVPGTTIMQILDIPILQDADNDAGFYVAAMGTGAGWTGAAIYKSADNVTFDEADVVTVESEMGSATTLLPSGPTTIWDDGNTVTVRLIEGALTSTSDLNAMAGINTISIGAPGRWEIVSFVNATLNGDGTYTLSRLLRGRLGTEWAVGLHAIGDAVVVLEAGALTRIVPSTADIGVPRYYKAISFGGGESDVITYAHQAVGLEPYSPAHVAGVYGADWAISWVRRGRIDHEWRSYVDVPIGELTEAYETDILRDGVVLRTLASATPTVTYTNAQMVTDFGFAKPMIDTKIYQLSPTVGRGYPVSTTLLAPSATVMHLKFDGVDGSTSIIDEKKHTFTASGTARLTAVNPLYGPTSLLLDGAGGLLTSADHADWELGGEDLTIEGFIRPSAVSINQVITTKRANSASYGPFLVMISSDNRIRLYASINGTTWDLDMYSATNVIAADTTYHFAFCRKGNSWYGLLDGAAVSSGSLSGAIVNNASSLFIGSDGDGVNPFKGRIGPLRMLKGAALYTGAYTVPIPPF